MVSSISIAHAAGFWLFLSIYATTVTDGQQTFNVTEFLPVGIDGANPLVSAVVNTSNISFYCVVIDADPNGSPVATTWSITPNGGSPDFISFSLEGIGFGELFHNYLTTPVAEFRRNLTILNFDSSFDNAQIGCGVGEDILVMFDLRINVPAGPPTSVTSDTITDTSVTLNWTPPDNLGVPQLSYYQLTLVPSPTSITGAVTGIDYTSVVINTNDNSSSVVINDLLPNTVYNISIVGVSTGNSFGILLGDNTTSITITTLTGGPLISDVNATVVNGSILISWSLIHTGGIMINQYYLYCDQQDTSDSSIIMGGAMVDRISTILVCSQQVNECNGDVLMDSSVVGPVVIGIVYSCSISVINDEGIDSRQINTITVTQQGLPSVPVILVSSTSSAVSNVLSIITSVMYAGNNDGSFRLIIDVYTNQHSSTVDSSELVPDYIRYTFNYPTYNDGGNVTTNITGLSSGSYTLIITSSNRYGESVNGATLQAMINESITSTPSQILVASSTDTTITETIQYCTSTSCTSGYTSTGPTNTAAGTSTSGSGIIIGCSVGITVVSIIAIVQLIIILLLFIHNKRIRGVHSITRVSSSSPLSVDRALSPSDVPVGGVATDSAPYEVVELKSINQSSSTLPDTITVTANQAYGELKPVYM